MEKCCKNCKHYGMKDNTYERPCMHEKLSDSFVEVNAPDEDFVTTMCFYPPDEEFRCCYYE